MILEAAILTVKPGFDAEFESAMRDAQSLIAESPGFRGLEVRPCVETPGRYLLLVWWTRLADHTQGFRGSARYQEWKARLHHFYEPFPTVEHYGPPIAASGRAPAP